MLALIDMATAKLLRLPDHWKRYDKVESSEPTEQEPRAGSVSGEECTQ